MISEDLQEILDRLEEARVRYKFELEAAPEGRLFASKRANGSSGYYVRLDENGKEVRKGIGKQPALIQALARKEFLLKALPALEKNIELLERTCEKYEPCQFDQIIGQLSATFRDLPEKYFFNPAVDVINLSLDAEDEKRIRAHAAWGAQAYTTDNYAPEGRTIITSRGERMRSKAEVLIAEKLYEYQIPFRYEQALQLGDITVHPDFTFEGANGDEFYLEFCGMMDDDAYVASHERKVALYASAGIVPWKNVIYLYASGNEMNMQRVESLIRTQIIPWL